MATASNYQRPGDPTTAGKPWIWITKEAHDLILGGFENSTLGAEYGLAIYLALIRLANDRDHDSQAVFEAPVGLIASLAGGISTKTVQRVLPVLEGLQLVKVERNRKSELGDLPNAFTLLLPAQKGGDSQSGGCDSKSGGCDSDVNGAKSDFLKNSKNYKEQKPPSPSKDEGRFFELPTEEAMESEAAQFSEEDRALGRSIAREAHAWMSAAGWQTKNGKSFLPEAWKHRIKADYEKALRDKQEKAAARPQKAAVKVPKELEPELLALASKIDGISETWAKHPAIWKEDAEAQQALRDKASMLSALEADDWRRLAWLYSKSETEETCKVTPNRIKLVEGFDSYLHRAMTEWKKDGSPTLRNQTRYTKKAPPLRGVRPPMVFNPADNFLDPAEREAYIKRQEQEKQNPPKEHHVPDVETELIDY